ncbi:metalloregulator ArsR/SmtB family transcription factor [[Pseudomonas] carboxydohydrogena]|uniref:Metalloregulator ArsR/SmtB family transcription factor n=1 Tax=Afipia carboxydohydrogena TaxID=290 RepID=A0ABY8BNG9_AFICR|nr:metalloregulator ArsR/SmtB family transcription factor [[Pseudomonas] carboxydohydrogena]WEF51519.1 metalloregulator ArsR/SmtB family transcription factor [[Pseudomonas] carboxydohydrogena]
MSIIEQAAIEGFGSLAQPTRLETMRLLLAAHPASVSAGEIAKRCDVPHNTMSNHLSILARAGLVNVEKDGRSMNYRADAGAFRSLIDFMARDCCGGRPELCGYFPDAVPPDARGETSIVLPSFNVLFLCTHNSARSIMAEALLDRLAGGKFRAYSAGSEPVKSPLPEVIERLKALGHDVSGLRSKSWNEFTGPNAPRMDFIIALCDTPEGQACPDFGDRFVTAAWPLPDPTKFVGSNTERTTLLNELYAMLRRRIEIFINLPFASLDRIALSKRLDEIGDTTRVAP